MSELKAYLVNAEKRSNSKWCSHACGPFYNLSSLVVDRGPSSISPFRMQNAMPHAYYIYQD